MSVLNHFITKIMPNFWQIDIHGQNLKKKHFLEYVDFWLKLLLFRTHHLRNSTNELIHDLRSREKQKVFSKTTSSM